MTKSGFVAIIGRPNAGKSSLMNYLLGEKIALVSQKANATRKRLQAIVMHRENQIIFVDTPGLHEKERLLNKFMLDEAIKAIGDSDLTIFLVPLGDGTEDYERFLKLTKRKHIVLITKMDSGSNSDLLKTMARFAPFEKNFEALLPFSINKNVGKEQLLDEISKLLPESPYLYDTDILTMENLRDIYREFIREAIFENISDEIPYATDVLIDQVDEKPKVEHIRATIIVEKDSQKAIIIGKGGVAVKRIGSSGRAKIEKLINKKVYLDLFVSVKKGWSKDKEALKNFGYIVGGD